jgi:hypothetical protein
MLPQTHPSEAAKRNINYNYLVRDRRGSNPASIANINKGRKPGSKNVVTSSMREMVLDFVAHNISGAQELYDRLAKRDPGKALQVLTNLCDFVLPRLARTEMNIHEGNTIIQSAPISDAASAASVYAAILGNSTIDLGLVTFAAAPPGTVLENPDRPAASSSERITGPSEVNPEPDSGEDLFE